ncbi:MAG TPA: hypothetical protein VGF40_08995 [Thermoanaerobaculia bacterium]
MIPLLLAAVLGGAPVEIRPAAPTVGVPIEIRFTGEERPKITIEKSDDYEIVRSGGPAAVVRSFRPGPITVRGRVEAAGGGFGFRALTIDVRSVLAEDDSLEPAPYRPPRELPPNRAAWWAVGLASLAAIALWAAVFRLRETAPRAAPAPGRPALAPRAEYLAELRKARALDLHPGVVVIAGALRRFLARVHPAWGLDLTSRELRRELRRHRVRTDIVSTVDQVLLEADLEKFSPWGAPEVDKDELIDRAERLVELDHGSREAEERTAAGSPYDGSREAEKRTGGAGPDGGAS